MTADAAPSTWYLVVERLHLRQWMLRAALPLAILATNGAGWLRVGFLPRHDAPGFSPGLALALRAAGAALVLGSAALRVAAKGVLVRKTTLTRAGVYGRVRHPFYLANLAGAAGTFLCAGPLGAVAGAGWLAAALPVFLVTVAGEEAGLRRLHGEEFERYAADVPALLPRARRTRGAPGGPTWEGLWTEREPPRLLRFVGGALLVAGSAATGAAAAALLAAGAASFAASYVVRRNVAPAPPPRSPHRP